MSENTCVNCFKSLGVPSRMELYMYLQTHEKSTVSELVKVVKLSQPTVSYHLKEMKYNGVLKSKKVGKEVFYSINTDCPHYNTACILQNVKFPSLADKYANN